MHLLQPRNTNLKHNILMCIINGYFYHKTKIKCYKFIILYFTNTLHTLMSSKKIILHLMNNDKSVSKYKIYIIYYKQQPCSQKKKILILFSVVRVD